MINPEPASLREVTTYLSTRREAILSNWRLACEQDELLSKVSALNRQEFNNLLPIVLDILQQRLLGEPEQADLLFVARGFGLHRWRKAHVLKESVQELRHFSFSLYNELQTFAELFPATHSATLLHVHRVIAGVMYDTVSGSLQKYDELQRQQAAARLSTLERAMTQLNEMVHDRGNILRESSHDLRSTVGIVYSAASLLQMEDITPEDRRFTLDMLQRNLGNVQLMLTNLMYLARLDSGLETLNVVKADASHLIREVVEQTREAARQQHTMLQIEGPDTLLVLTDRIKLHRILQNLLFKALKHTASQAHATVLVSWSAQQNGHWTISIQYPAAGMPQGAAAPSQGSPGRQPGLPFKWGKGEGISQHIVRHLCEMLHATLDTQRYDGSKTIIGLTLPVHYDRD